MIKVTWTLSTEENKMKQEKQIRYTTLDQTAQCIHRYLFKRK